MRGHLSADLEPAAVLEVGGDAGGAEGVTTNLGLDPCSRSSAANHPPDIGLEQGIAGQLAGAAASGAEERPFPICGDAGSRDVLLQIAIEIVVGGHLVLLATLL